VTAYGAADSGDLFWGLICKREGFLSEKLRLDANVRRFLLYMSRFLSGDGHGLENLWGDFLSTNSPKWGIPFSLIAY